MLYTYQTPYGDSLQINIVKSKYGNGHNKIQMMDTEDGMPYATASVSIPDLTEDEVGVKDYSENEGVLAFLLENNIVEPPHRTVSSGFVNIPVCRLK